MGIFSFIRNQLIEIVEWLDDTNYTLVWRFPDRDHEIKMGAKLVVREGQCAVFVNEGKLADVFLPGTHTLTTQNMPVLSTLRGWKYGFESPFKAEVYFVNTRQYLDQKWGTSNPILLRDPEFGPVRIRAFGIYAFRVTDAALFMREVVGTDGHFTVEEIEGQLKRTLVSKFTSSVAASRIPVLEMAAHYDRVQNAVVEAMQPDFEALGLRLTRFVIENISFPPEVEKILDQRSGVGIVGNQMAGFAQLAATQAMRDAAAKGGSAASDMMGLGAGFAMANLMAQQMNQAQAPQQANQAAQAPVPPPVAGNPCVSCRQVVAPGARFCQHCGAKQDFSCPACRKDLAPGAKFCSDCGQRIG